MRFLTNQKSSWTEVHVSISYLGF